MPSTPLLIPVEIIPRHVHLSEKDWRRLFGKNQQPRVWRSLSQRGQEVFFETIKVIGKKTASLENFHVIGGWRKQTQVEVSAAEAAALGLENVPFRLSGRLIRSPGCRLVGPAGRVALKQGVIIPIDHLHLSVKEAERFNLKHGQVVNLNLLASKKNRLENIIVRVHPSFRLALHVTPETAARFWLMVGDRAFLEN